MQQLGSFLRIQALDRHTSPRGYHRRDILRSYDGAWHAALDLRDRVWILLFQPKPVRLGPRRGLIVAVLPGNIFFDPQALDLRCWAVRLFDRGPQTNFRGGFVHQVNGLVWQPAILNVAFA